MARPGHIVGEAPVDLSRIPEYTLQSLRDFTGAEGLLQLSLGMLQSVKREYDTFSLEDFRAWMEAPGSRFVVLSQGEHFLGILYVLRLKPEVFEELMAFKRNEATLGVGDFALPGEPASLFIPVFYTLNARIGARIFADFYAYLAGEQSTIRELGFLAQREVGQRIGERMELTAFAREPRGEESCVAYRGDLFRLFSGEAVIRSLFGKARPLA